LIKVKISFLFFLVLLSTYYIFHYVSIVFAQEPYLEVNLTLPPDPTNVVQNRTFIVNATVYCRDVNCGNVNGTVRYNLTTENPDTPVNVTQGDQPLFIQESPALSMKACPTNPLDVDEFCNLTWVINATGSVSTELEIGVLFNSSDISIVDNNTQNSTVSITDCTLDFSLMWSSIDFDNLNPNTNENSAPGNSDNEYNISVNYGSCNLDFYINGTDMENATFKSKVGVDNITWSNVSNDYSTSYNLSKTISPIKINIPENTNVTTWYWLNVPPVYAGKYNGTIIIHGVKNGESPP
jgi:hypothetical protein